MTLDNGIGYDYSAHVSHRERSPIKIAKVILVRNSSEHENLFAAVPVSQLGFRDASSFNGKSVLYGYSICVELVSGAITVLPKSSLAIGSILNSGN